MMNPLHVLTLVLFLLAALVHENTGEKQDLAVIRDTIDVSQVGQELEPENWQADEEEEKGGQVAGDDGPQFKNGGTPKGISKDVDCALREMAYEYGKSLKPDRGHFKSLFDALQLHVCLGNRKNPFLLDDAADRNESINDGTWQPPKTESGTGNEIHVFVDAEHGNDTHGTGSIKAPFKSILHALKRISSPNSKILLREGTYPILETLQIDDSIQMNGLTIENYNGERATITGSEKLEFTTPWKVYKKEKNVWMTKVKNPKPFDGLRVGKERAIRAKYPNGAPELSGENFVTKSQDMGAGQYVKGWIVNKTKWFPDKRKNDPKEIVITGKDWPSVFWPTSEEAGADPEFQGHGQAGEYHMGLGGVQCQDVSPPFGYYCAKHPPRGIESHHSPKGFQWGEHLARGKNYSRPQDAIVVGWRNHGRWYTNVWKIKDWFKENATASFTLDSGFHGAEGSGDAAEWYIENVLEELDEANEWYFDENEGMLYFAFNHTEPQKNQVEFRAVRTKVLFNVSNVDNFKISGVEIRDAAMTILDPHGLPSGGDWALQRLAAITVENSTNFTLCDSLVERVDGLGVILNGRNRNATIINNEFAWIGETAIASWGKTGYCLNENCTQRVPYPVGPDGREGNQPRGTRLVGNIIREVGVFQKQASAYFHAVSGFATISGNVIFNGPRAMVNFNDGFLGGDEFSRNLMINAVRESGDHASFNSWDRVPYIHEFGDTVVSIKRRLHHNMILGTYATQECFDTDDGSSQYEFYSNVNIFGEYGKKDNFGGHNTTNHDELVILVSKCFTLAWPGRFNRYENQTCILRDNDWGYFSDCQVRKQTKITMIVRNNTIATKSGKARMCGTDLPSWQKLGHDPLSRAIKWPSVQQIVAMAKMKLNF